MMMSSVNVCLYFYILAFLVLDHNSHSLAQRTGCSADPLIADRPFVVVWNHPTHNCEDKGINIDFQKWGIIDNDRDRFFGQKIVLFYNLGKWPFYQNNQPVNSGLPQLADVDAHLANVDSDLKTNVWNKSFSGVGVIDMEHWRPLLWLNFDSLKIYQEKSLALARQRFPQYNASQLKAEAIKEFDTAAKEIMERTLDEVTMKRPNGKWGYYLYPRTWGKSTVSDNDRMSWVFQKSTGLYPSIYFKLKEPPSSRQTRIKDTLHEAIRVKAKYAPQDAPIMPYAQNQEGPYHLFDKSDLSYAILQPAQMGSSGVVLWGSSHDALAKNECLILQDYVKNTLGPFSLNVANFFGNCSQQLCNNHGRCVRKDYEKIYQSYLRESNRNECLISEEVLGNQKVSPKVTGTYYTDQNSKERISRRNQLSIFRKFFKLKFSNRKRNIKTFTIESKYDEVSHKQKYESKFVNIMGQVYKKHSTFSKEMQTKRKKPMDSLNFYQESNLFPNIENKIPDYDFDDYVCKCFADYSGTHCQNSEL